MSSLQHTAFASGRLSRALHLRLSGPACFTSPHAARNRLRRRAPSSSMLSTREKLSASYWAAPYHGRFFVPGRTRRKREPRQLCVDRSGWIAVGQRLDCVAANGRKSRQTAGAMKRMWGTAAPSAAPRRTGEREKPAARDVAQPRRMWACAQWRQEVWAGARR